MKKLFIGKLSFTTTESALRKLFSPYEPLMSLKILCDNLTGQSRGFGFIEIDDNAKASDAIKALNGALLDGKTIEVNEARPQTGGRGSGGFRPRGGSSRPYRNSGY